jgi:hypothetical protein
LQRPKICFRFSFFYKSGRLLSFFQMHVGQSGWRRKKK